MTSLPFIIMQSNAFSPVRSVNFRGNDETSAGVDSASGWGDGCTWGGTSGLDSFRGGRGTDPEVSEDGDGDRDWD